MSSKTSTTRKSARRQSSVPSARKISYGTRIENILIQENINITALKRSDNDALLNKIIEILKRRCDAEGVNCRSPVGTPSGTHVNFQIKIILEFIISINTRREIPNNFFHNVRILCENYNKKVDEVSFISYEDKEKIKEKEKEVNFQSKIFKDEDKEKEKEVNFQSKIFKDEDNDFKDIFGLFKLFEKESPQKFITIDPTIIQIMIFDNYNDNDKDSDIVYSLKIIIVNNNTLTIRYTTQLFPANSIIKNFSELSGFNRYTTSLNNPHINKHYSDELINFLKNYIKYYNFYKKCYEIECDSIKKTINDYQLRYISILGKARFWYPEVQARTAIITDYLQERGVNVRYLHSEVDTLRRVELLRELRTGDYDVLIGINLLREGLDLPEVSLVAILDADKEGFLRSATSSLKLLGRELISNFREVLVINQR